jgi:hypothetical protein
MEPVITSWCPAGGSTFAPAELTQMRTVRPAGAPAGTLLGLCPMSQCLVGDQPDSDCGDRHRDQGQDHREQS